MCFWTRARPQALPPLTGERPLHARRAVAPRPGEARTRTGHACPATTRARRAAAPRDPWSWWPRRRRRVLSWPCSARAQHMCSLPRSRRGTAKGRGRRSACGTYKDRNGAAVVRPRSQLYTHTRARARAHTRRRALCGDTKLARQTEAMAATKMRTSVPLAHWNAREGAGARWRQSAQGGRSAAHHTTRGACWLHPHPHTENVGGLHSPARRARRAVDRVAVDVPGDGREEVGRRLSCAVPKTKSGGQCTRSDCLLVFA